MRSTGVDATSIDGSDVSVDGDVGVGRSSVSLSEVEVEVEVVVDEHFEEGDVPSDLESKLSEIIGFGTTSSSGEMLLGCFEMAAGSSRLELEGRANPFFLSSSSYPRPESTPK